MDLEKELTHTPVLISILPTKGFDQHLVTVFRSLDAQRRCLLSTHALPEGLKTHFKKHDRFVRLTTADPSRVMNETLREEAFDVLILDTRNLGHEAILETFIHDAKEEDKHAIIACEEDDKELIRQTSIAINTSAVEGWKNGVAIASILFLGLLSLQSLFESTKTTPIGLALMTEPVDVALPIFLFLVALFMGIILYLVQYNQSKTSFYPSDLQLKPRKVTKRLTHHRFKPVVKA